MSQFRYTFAALLLAVSPPAIGFAQTAAQNQAPTSVMKSAPAKSNPAAAPATSPAGSGTRAGAKAAPAAAPKATTLPATPAKAEPKEAPSLAVPVVGKPADVKVTAAPAETSAAGTSAVKPRLEKLDLKYIFTKGETLRSRVTQQTRVETSISGSTQIAEMASVSVKRWGVKDVDKDGNVTFETQWDSIDMRQKMTGREEVHYNSATDKTPPAGYDQIAAMIGKPLSLITTDARGKIIRREAKDADTKKTLATSTYQAEQQLLVPLPGEAVTLGQPWSIPNDIRVSLDDNKSSRTIQARHRYEVEKLDGDVAVIAHETILPPMSDPEIRSQVIQQLGRGTVRFDTKTGKVLQHVSEVDERVIGFRGAESSIHLLSKFTEELFAGDRRTSKGNHRSNQHGDEAGSTSREEVERKLALFISPYPGVRNNGLPCFQAREIRFALHAAAEFGVVCKFAIFPRA